MTASVDSVAELSSAKAWRSSLLLFNAASGEYGFAIPFGDALLFEPIDFCPWCGSALTSSVRAAS